MSYLLVPSRERLTFRLINRLSAAGTTTLRRLPNSISQKINLHSGVAVKTAPARLGWPVNGAENFQSVYYFPAHYNRQVAARRRAKTTIIACDELIP